jgi:hypothetical protein
MLSIILFDDNLEPWMCTADRNFVITPNGRQSTNLPNVGRRPDQVVTKLLLQTDESRSPSEPANNMKGVINGGENSSVMDHESEFWDRDWEEHCYGNFWGWDSENY